MQSDHSKAMASPSPKLFSPTTKSECRHAVKLLQKEAVIALDSEGVQLGKDGPLTLLQIGTQDGRVYLFDVMINEREQDKTFFKDTGLDTILESAEIVKVIQSCSGDSAALYHQFNIRLQSVFDTQVAYLVIEEDKGRRHPSRVKLAEICELYSGKASVYQGKEDVQMEWNKQVGNFWAKRPLTQEMIEYASGDVTALIPEVYEKQKRYIEEKGLGDLFDERVLEEIEYEIDPAAKERRRERNNAISDKILQEMSTKYKKGTDFTTITDEDEIRALKDTSIKELADYPEIIKELKLQWMKFYLKSVEEQLEDPSTFIQDRGLMSKLNDIAYCGSDLLQNEAAKLKRQVVEIVTKDIQQKYHIDTPLEHISQQEYLLIRGLKPISDDEPEYPPTVTALHWKIAEKEIREGTEKLKDNLEGNTTLSIPKMNFWANSTDVPRKVKELAQLYLKKYESAIVEQIPRKYTTATRPDELSDAERNVIERLRLSTKRYNPVVVSLHWKIIYEKVGNDLEKYRNGNLVINDGSRRWLNFLANNDSVQDDVGRKAREFLRELPKTSQSSRGRGRRN